MLRIDLQHFGGRGASSGSGGGIPKSNISGHKGRIEKDSFFGTVAKTSNQYMKFDQVTSKDKCIVMTTNVRVIKGNPVLVTGNNTAVYLKEWQFRRMVDKSGNEAYAVKLDKKYFKEYTFKSRIDDTLSFNKNDSFDSFHKVAVKQQKSGKEWKSGGRTYIGQNSMWHDK